MRESFTRIKQKISKEQKKRKSNDKNICYKGIIISVHPKWLVPSPLSNPKNFATHREVKKEKKIELKKRKKFFSELF